MWMGWYCACVHNINGVVKKIITKILLLILPMSYVRQMTLMEMIHQCTQEELIFLNDMRKGCLGFCLTWHRQDSVEMNSWCDTISGSIIESKSAAHLFTADLRQKPHHPTGNHWLHSAYRVIQSDFYPWHWTKGQAAVGSHIRCSYITCTNTHTHIYKSTPLCNNMYRPPHFVSSCTASVISSVKHTDTCHLETDLRFCGLVGSRKM